MGCGESKLAVATGNTILRRKKPKAGTGDSIKKGKDIGTVSENATEYDSTRPQQHDQQGAIREQAVNRVDNVDDVKDINETKKENGDDHKQVIDKSDNKVVEIPEHDAGRLITSEDSPRSFFSSRKLDEEGIDGIISEGRSGTSDYYTPRHGRVNSFFKGEESGGAVEDKESLPAPEETKLAETTTTEDKGEAVVLVEETLVKEPAEVEITATVVEAAAVPNPAAEGTKKVDIEKEETKKDEITNKEEKK